MNNNEKINATKNIIQDNALGVFLILTFPIDDNAPKVEFCKLILLFNKLLFSCELFSLLLTSFFFPKILSLKRSIYYIYKIKNCVQFTFFFYFLFYFMEELSVNVLVDAKTEYTKQLTNLISPLILEGFLSIYDESLEIKSSDLDPKYQEYSNLQIFQELLKKIPKWNQDIIDTETDRIVKKTKCDWLDDLVGAVFISNAKVLSVIKTQNRKTEMKLKVPKLENFIHKCYVEAAREFYQSAYLFDDEDITSIEKQKNMRNAIDIIKESIIEAVRRLLPVHEIIKTCLGNIYPNDEDDDISVYSANDMDKSLKEFARKNFDRYKEKEEFAQKEQFDNELKNLDQENNAILSQNIIENISQKENEEINFDDQKLQDTENKNEEQFQPVESDKEEEEQLQTAESDREDEEQLQTAESDREDEEQFQTTESDKEDEEQLQNTESLEQDINEKTADPIKDIYGYLPKKKEKPQYKQELSSIPNDLDKNIKHLSIDPKGKSKNINFNYDGIEKKKNKLKKPKNIMRNKDFIRKRVEENLMNIVQNTDNKKREESDTESLESNDPNNEFVFFNDANELDREL